MKSIVHVFVFSIYHLVNRYMFAPPPPPFFFHPICTYCQRAFKTWGNFKIAGHMLITQYFKNQLCLDKMKMEYVIIYLRNWVKNNTAKKC